MLLSLLLSVSTFLPTSMAQEVVGVDKCACTPGVYEFTLDFSLVCDVSKIATGEGSGIQEVACVILEDNDDPITDFSFVEVTEIVSSEVDQNGAEVARSTLVESFSNGDTFTFTSTTSTNRSLDSISIPLGLALSIRGANALGQPIVNNWFVIFTNDCLVFPVFNNGFQIGVTTLVRLS